MKSEDQEVTYKPNREKRIRASKSKFWCWRCDGALVGQYGKCPQCGYINGRRQKKALKG